MVIICSMFFFSRFVLVFGFLLFSVCVFFLAIGAVEIPLWCRLPAVVRVKSHGTDGHNQ